MRLEQGTLHSRQSKSRTRVSCDWLLLVQPAVTVTSRRRPASARSGCAGTPGLLRWRGACG